MIAFDSYNSFVLFYDYVRVLSLAVVSCSEEKLVVSVKHLYTVQVSIARIIPNSDFTNAVWVELMHLISLSLILEASKVTLTVYEVEIAPTIIIGNRYDRAIK